MRVEERRKKTKKRKENRDKEDSIRMGDLRWGEESNEVQEKAKKLVSQRFYK